jgi:hypothetical protein
MAVRQGSFKRARAYPAGIASAKHAPTVASAIQMLVMSETSASPRGLKTCCQNFVP